MVDKQFWHSLVLGTELLTIVAPDATTVELVIPKSTVGEVYNSPPGVLILMLLESLINYIRFLFFGMISSLKFPLFATLTGSSEFLLALFLSTGLTAVKFLLKSSKSGVFRKTNNLFLVSPSG